MGQRGTRLTKSQRDKLTESGQDIIPPSRAQNRLKFSGMNTTNPGDFVFEDYALQLASQADWDRYTNTPADRIFAGTQVTKVVVATPSSSLKKYKAHFLHSQTYTYHYQFCTSILKYKEDLGVFNVDMYRKPTRDYILGTIVYYKDHDFYCFELWPGDNLPPNQLLEVMEYISGKVFFEPKLKWRASSAAQLLDMEEYAKGSHEAAEFLKKRLVTNQALFGGVRYQPLTTGTTFGKVVFMSQEESYGSLEHVSKDWIVVCDGIPVDLPVVRGLVTAQLQTPLCHVALLCSNRATPNMALKDAHEVLKPYENKLVKLHVTTKGYTIEEASAADEEAWLSQKRVSSGANIDLVYDLSEVDFVDISSKLTKYQIQAVGTKAAGLAKIARLELPNNNRLPLQWAFVVPFSIYKQHVQQSCAQEHQAVLDAYKAGKNANDALAALRAAIESRPIEDQKVVDQIQARLQAWKAAGVFDKAAGAIFRSSTNVEDLPGFNGAGLYLSEPLRHPDCLSKSNIEKVLKQVWASLWNSRGFIERQEFGLKQEEVFMAVIVMPFLEAFANGVAITGNPFRADFNAYFINSQVAGKRVTDNCDGETPEQILIYDDVEPTPELIATSSLMKGGVIIRDEDIDRMWGLLQTLHKKFAAKKKNLTAPEGFQVAPAVDVEFLVLDDKVREFCILQCRPYTVKYQILDE